MKTKIQIKSVFGSLLFEYGCEDNSIRKTVEKAVERVAYLSGADLIGANLIGANLSGAYLRGADLSGAYLRVANLSGANLSGANLSGADLIGANLRGAYLRVANLSGANLSGANLSGADLSGADLIGANLSGANLSGAYLRGADLSGAYLRGADLTPIKDDLFVVLLHGLHEIKHLKKALIEGKINGSTYDGECSCLSGTLYNGAVKNDGPQEKHRIDTVMACRDASRPIERFFLGINIGDTPENNQPAKLVMEWIGEFEKLIGQTFE